MSQSPNSNKYDILLNEFLKSDSSVDEKESEQMKQWLDEAANNLRNQFQNYRNNTEQINSVGNQANVSPNSTSERGRAMCVSLPSDSSDEDSYEEDKKIEKRSRDNYFSDIEMPSPKRSTKDQSFLKEVLSLDMISLSSGLKHEDINDKANVVHSSYSESNVSQSNKTVYILGCHNLESMTGQIGKDVIPKPTAANSLVTVEKSNESTKYFNRNVKKQKISLQEVSAVNGSSSNCIWPIGLSYQPDFIEVVITDDEMNGYWDTIKDFF